jgi:hypothetical protein
MSCSTVLSQEDVAQLIAPESSRFDSTLGEEVSERLTLSPGPDCFRIEPSLPSRATRRLR